MDINIRKVEEKDIEGMIEIAHEAWFKDMYETEEFEKAASAISLNKALYNSSTGWVAEVDGEVMGLLLSSITGHEPTYRKFQTNTLENLIQLSQHGKQGEMDRMIRTFEVENSYSQFLEESEEQFDASIEYLAVSSKVRGKGLGKSLLFEAMKEFTKENCNNLYLFTDADYDYEFYEALEFNLIENLTIELHTKSGSRQRKEYMYAYDFEK